MTAWTEAIGGLLPQERQFGVELLSNLTPGARQLVLAAGDLGPDDAFLPLDVIGLE